jgi:hypothetical protein
MAGFEILFEAVDKASPSIQQLSQLMVEAAQKSDRFAQEMVAATRKADEGLGKIPPKAKEAGQSLDSLKGAGEQLKQQLLGFATVAGITAFFKSSADAALEEEEALRRLSFAVNATGGSFDKSKEQIIAFANEQQALTRFSDTQTFDTMGRLVRVTGDVGQAMQATKLAFGLASASGKDLGFIVEQLGSVLAGETRGIATLRKEFGAFIGDADTGQEVVDALSGAFLSAAEKEQGFAIEMARTKNALGDFQEQVGGGVLRGFRLFLDAVVQGAKFLEILGTVIANFAAKSVVNIETLAEKTKAVFTGNFDRLPQIAQEKAAKLAAIEEESGAQAAEIDRRYSKQRVETAREEGRIKTAVSTEAREAADREAREKTRAEESFRDKVKEIEIELLQLRGQSFEAEVEKIGLERDQKVRALDEVFAKTQQTEALKNELASARVLVEIDTALKIAEAHKKAYGDIEEVAKQVNSTLASSASSAVADIILQGKSMEDAFKQVLGSILRTAIETFVRIQVEAAVARAASQGVLGSTGAGLGAAGAIGIIAGTVASIFKFQHGGVVTKPTLGLVGEAGPEAVIPLSRAGSLSGDVQVTVNQTNNLTVNGVGDDQVRTIMQRISEVTRSGAAEGAELVKSILANEKRFARESV